MSLLFTLRQLNGRIFILVSSISISSGSLTNFKGPGMLLTISSVLK